MQTMNTFRLAVFLSINSSGINTMRMFRAMWLGLLFLSVGPVWATQCPPTVNIPFLSIPCNTDPRVCSTTLFGTASLGLGGNAFDNINTRRSFGNPATITFSESPVDYFFGSLTLLSNDTITLNAGQTYYIRNLSLGSGVRFLVRNSIRSGPARIVLGSAANFPRDVFFNSPSLTQSGDVAQLLMFGHGSITIGDSSAFSGSLFSTGTLTVGSSSRLNGIISGVATCF